MSHKKSGIYVRVSTYLVFLHVVPILTQEKKVLSIFNITSQKEIPKIVFPSFPF